MKQSQRNFVAKNSKSCGSGYHKDKKYEAKNGIAKHKAKPFYTIEKDKKVKWFALPFLTSIIT